MIPSVLAGQIQQGLKDYIDTTFPITNLVFKDSLKNMLSEPKKVFHEPYVAVRLPFRVAENEELPFQAIHPVYTPYVHQQKAFKRLTGEDGRSTLVATGTGSGKTDTGILLSAQRRNWNQGTDHLSDECVGFRSGKTYR